MFDIRVLEVVVLLHVCSGDFVLAVLDEREDDIQMGIRAEDKAIKREVLES